MAVVKVSPDGRLRLPVELRAALGLEEGGRLEAEVVGEVVVLRPAKVDRAQAWREVMEIVRTPKWRGPGPESGADEVMAMVVDEIHAMRREDDEGRPR